MKIYSCSHCANVVHFENNTCEACGHSLGYQPWDDAMRAMPFTTEPVEARTPFFCSNAESAGCNWLIEPGPAPDVFCRACRHNGVIPDLSLSVNQMRWRQLEEAKRRLFYSLLRWRLPIPTMADDPERGLRFEFLADQGGGAPKVMTGHDGGLITISIAEADDVERERRRTAMGEPYRTIIGHFRHEIGHYYWDLLVRDGSRLDECRALFGDDRQDYSEALERHHQFGPPQDWRDGYVSAYATMHPWEDFAETWAHCMHIVDTLETATSFGLSVRPKVAAANALSTELRFDPYEMASFDDILTAWGPVSIAVNAVNRSMGMPDLYPFVLNPAVVAKLAFVHDLIHEAGA